MSVSSTKLITIQLFHQWLWCYKKCHIIHNDTVYISVKVLFQRVPSSCKVSNCIRIIKVKFKNKAHINLYSSSIIEVMLCHFLIPIIYEKGCKILLYFTICISSPIVLSTFIAGCLLGIFLGWPDEYYIFS